LRAVAVLLVVVGHAGIRRLGGGFVGVDVFFVLSGFLITGLLLAEARAHASVSLLDFYLRRARRILPAAALTLVVTNVAAFYVMNFMRARDAVHDGLSAAAFAANFHFAASGVDYFAQSDPPSPILHYWSLSVEEQFYVAWPLLLSLALFGTVSLAHRRKARTRERRLLGAVLVLATASAAWSVHLTGTAPTSAYFSPFTRAWELGLGATIAVCATSLEHLPGTVKVAMGWAGVTAIAASAVVFSEQTPFPGSAAVLPTGGTALAIIAGMGARPHRLAVGRLLSLRPMFMIGDRSYAFYLWHWPVLILADAYAGRELSTPTKLLLMTGAFGLSCVSYALVENPIRHRVHSRRTTVVVAFACMAAVVGTASLSLTRIDRAEARFEESPSGVQQGVALPSGQLRASTLPGGTLPVVVASVRAARRGAPIPKPLVPGFRHLGGLPAKYAPANDCISHDRSSRSTARICRMGDRSSRKLIVLVGDSHAMMWLPTLLEMAKRDHLAVIPLLRLGCTPAKWFSGYGTPACHAWYAWAARQIERLRPQVTFVGGSVPEHASPGTTAAVDGLVAAAGTLARRGRTVVIGDPEGLDFNPVDCLLSRNASMAKCTTTWPLQSLAAYNAVERRVTGVHAGFLRTRGFVCFERSCPAVVGHTIAWVDNNHMSAAYASELAAPFRAALVRAVSRTP
jgi:peptidoglycan/LPS O-acetylase OafA/YrhL